jgi:hypothetical protein
MVMTLFGPLPMVISVSKITQALYRVFSLPTYLGVSGGVTLMAISLIAFVPNWTLMGDFLTSAEATLQQKILFIFQLYLNLDTHMYPAAVVTTVIISILLGINSALLVYYIRFRRQSGRNKVGHAAGVLGLVAGVFGIGCAACGSLIIASLLSVVGAAGLLATLPFGGGEFSAVGIVLLGYSIIALTQRIADPLVCPST